MGKDTKIGWTDHTFNPWSGCTKVSPGCANCYAEGLAARTGGTLGGWGQGAPRKRTGAHNWNEPVRWDREAGNTGVRRKVFCASLADWLDDEVPLDWLADLLALVIATPNLDWLLLTKRPENFTARIGAVIGGVEARPGWDELPNSHALVTLRNTLADWVLLRRPPANVQVGATVENQAMADRRIPLLLAIPAKVRFLSCEPLLSAVDITAGFFLPVSPERFESHEGVGGWAGPLPRGTAGIGWVIAGGESGARARPAHPEWFRALRESCRRAGVPFFFKQWGEWGAADESSYEFRDKPHWVGKAHRNINDGVCLDMAGRVMKAVSDLDSASYPVAVLQRRGVHATGNSLDGFIHEEFPRV